MLRAIKFKAYGQAKNFSKAFFMHERKTMRRMRRRGKNTAYLLLMKQKSNVVPIKRLQIYLMENLRRHLSSPHFLKVRCYCLSIMKAIKKSTCNKINPFQKIFLIRVQQEKIIKDLKLIF